jgi:hypothetical protein
MRLETVDSPLRLKIKKCLNPNLILRSTAAGRSVCRIMTILKLVRILSRLSLGTGSSCLGKPNHFHGILIFHDCVGATRPDLISSHLGKGDSHHSARWEIDGLPLPRGPKQFSLGAIIAQFKSRVTKRLWKIHSLKDRPIWQRNYYEHIIRNEKDLQNKTDYINANPLLWEQDDENPINLNP